MREVDSNGESIDFFECYSTCVPFFFELFKLLSDSYRQYWTRVSTLIQGAVNEHIGLIVILYTTVHVIIPVPLFLDLIFVEICCLYKLLAQCATN
jgi:hypothetical protein